MDIAAYKELHPLLVASPPSVTGPQGSTVGRAVSLWPDKPNLTGRLTPREYVQPGHVSVAKTLKYDTMYCAAIHKTALQTADYFMVFAYLMVIDYLIILDTTS